jgi:hypothetical protein
MSDIRVYSTAAIYRNTLRTYTGQYAQRKAGSTKCEAARDARVAHSQNYLYCVRCLLHLVRKCLFRPSCSALANIGTRQP